MDVRLSKSRVFHAVIACVLFLVACGNRFDLDTERGRQARIDDANAHLSRGECQQAVEAILPLYNSPHVDDEVRLVTASAYACFGAFNLLTLSSNLFGATNYFNALAKTMPNTLGDGRIAGMYQAVDILTSGNVVLNASARSTKINTYMVFLQMGVIGAIQGAYGSPSATGAQGATLNYSNPRAGGDMSNVDACALAGAFSSLVDSYDHSSLNDTDSRAVRNNLESTCVAAGLASCTVINRNRTLCTGAGGDPPSVAASSVVGAVNNAW